MEAPTLLLADSNEAFCQELTHALQGRYRVRCCMDGKQALLLLRQLRPEVLVLDLMLPKLDGISLLQAASQEGLKPKVLATTSLVSDYVVEAADHFGVGYIIRKPCDIQATAMRVSDLDAPLHLPGPSGDPSAHTTDSLLALGVVPKHRGYHYLREGIVLLARDPTQSVTKVLYPAIAAQWDVDVRHVERSIHNALNAAWDHRNEAVWLQYFPSCPDRCPSNGAFLARLAEDLR